MISLKALRDLLAWQNGAFSIPGKVRHAYKLKYHFDKVEIKLSIANRVTMAFLNNGYPVVQDEFTLLEHDKFITKAKGRVYTVGEGELKFNQINLILADTTMWPYREFNLNFLKKDKLVLTVIFSLAPGETFGLTLEKGTTLIDLESLT